MIVLTSSFGRTALLVGLCCLALVACQDNTGQQTAPNQTGSTTSYGSFPVCTTDGITFTTTAVANSNTGDHTTAVDIATTLTNRRDAPCRIDQPISACASDPTVEVVDASGHVVWSPRLSITHCPPRPLGSPPLVLVPGRPITEHFPWDLTRCAETGGCMQTRVPPGEYRVRGYSEVLGRSQPAPVVVR